MNVTYNHTAIATAEFEDPKFEDARYRLTVTRVNGCPTAKFELDGFDGKHEDGVTLHYMFSGMWLDFVAEIPACASYAVDTANAAQACFKQVMAT